MKREFRFKIEEIKNVYDSKMPDRKRAEIFTTTGIVWVNHDEEIEIFVDDEKQPHDMFEVKDSFFKKIIRKIHETTKFK